jgi:DNA topoisomerase IB
MSEKIDTFVLSLSDFSDSIKKSFSDPFEKAEKPKTLKTVIAHKKTGGTYVTTRHVAIGEDMKKLKPKKDVYEGLDPKIAEKLKTLNLTALPAGVDWKKVKINLKGNLNDHAILEWVNPYGNRKFAYTKEHSDEAHVKKEERISRLFPNRNKFREAFKEDAMNGNEEAMVCYILSTTGLRRGKINSFKGTGNRGINTLSYNNIEIDDSKIKFDFIGKSSKHNTGVLKDKEFAAALSKYIHEKEKTDGKTFDTRYFDKKEKVYKTRETETNFVFGLPDEKIDNYFHSVCGQDFTVKDFRTIVAKERYAKETAKYTKPPKEMPKVERQKIIEKLNKEAIEAVAKYLNNTPAMARDSYIGVETIEKWKEEFAKSKQKTK